MTTAPKGNIIFIIILSIIIEQANCLGWLDEKPEERRFDDANPKGKPTSKSCVSFHSITNNIDADVSAKTKQEPETSFC